MSSYEVSVSFDDIEDRDKKKKAERLVKYQSLISEDVKEDEEKAATKKQRFAAFLWKVGIAMSDKK